MAKLYTISFVKYGGITIEAESEEEALDIFNSDAGQEDAMYELANNYSPLDITDIIEEEE